MLYNGTPLSPSNLPLCMWWSGCLSNAWLLGPTQVHNPNGISIGAAVFAGLTSVTDRLTDNATQSVTVGRIYVHSAAMRPNNNNNCHCFQQWTVIFINLLLRNSSTYWICHFMQNCVLLNVFVVPAHSSRPGWRAIKRLLLFYPLLNYIVN